jgi:hypothetical protein
MNPRLPRKLKRDLMKLYAGERITRRVVSWMRKRRALAVTPVEFRIQLRTRLR